MTYRVVVADAERARFFSLDTSLSPDRAAPAALEEHAMLVDPEQRIVDPEMFSAVRPGLRRGQKGGPRHAVDDRRLSVHAEQERRFASRIWHRVLAEHVDDVDPTTWIIVAGPAMLGALRTASDTWHVAPPIVVLELRKELTHLSPQKLHATLHEAELLPSRTR